MGSKARLAYSDTISSPSSNYRLIELPPNILKEFKDYPETVISIKGKPEEEAVLCTATQTYALRLAMSSNTLLLVPPSSNSNNNNNNNNNNNSDNKTNLSTSTTETMTAVASVSSHYEIQEKLAGSMYKGEDHEEEVKEKERHTFSSLAQSVQASDRELLDWLYESNAILLDGYWRGLDVGFLTEAVDLLLSNAIIHQWPLPLVDEQAVLSAMQDYNPKVLLHILSLYASKLPADDGPAQWRMDFQKLNASNWFYFDYLLDYLLDYLFDYCKIFRATQILREVMGSQNISKYTKSKNTFDTMGGTGMIGKDWRLADFMAAWQDAVPQPQIKEGQEKQQKQKQEENKVSESQLAGVAVVVKTGDEQYVRYLPAADVKNVIDPRDRFRLLFSVRPRWKLDEFEPYVSDLAKDKQSLEQLVVKNGRPIMQEGVRVYCSRD